MAISTAMARATHQAATGGPTPQAGGSRTRLHSLDGPRAVVADAERDQDTADAVAILAVILDARLSRRLTTVVDAAIAKRWFSYRKANPGGRRSSPLDEIHADRWPHEWTAELNDLLTVLRRLVELEPEQEDLLDRIVTGPQITVADLTSAKVFPVSDRVRKAHRHAPGLFS